jgi:hypothetical protein
MNNLFNIFPKIGYKNTQFQIVKFGNFKGDIQIIKDGKIIKNIYEENNRTIILNEIKIPGKYQLKSISSNTVLTQNFEVLNSIRLGSSELNKVFTFDDIQYSFLLMKDRLLIFDSNSNKIYQENIFPNEIVKINNSLLLFSTLYKKNGNQLNYYAIYSIDTFNIIYDFDISYKQILFNQDDGILWLEDIENKKIKIFDLNNDNQFLSKEYDYIKYEYSKMNKSIFIQSKDKIIIIEGIKNKIIEFEINENISIDFNGNIIINEDDSYVIKKLYDLYETSQRISKNKKYKFETNKFFYLGSNFKTLLLNILESTRNDVAKKYIPDETYIGDYFKKELPEIEKCNEIFYTVEFYPYKESLFLVEKIKTYSYSNVIYRKRNNMWLSEVNYQDTIEFTIYFQNKYNELNSLQKLKTLNNIIYSRTGIIIPQKNESIIFNSTNGHFYSVESINKFVKTIKKDYLFLNIDEKDIKIVETGVNEKIISKKCTILNIDNFIKHKTLWIAELKQEGYFGLKGIDLVEGKEIYIKDYELRNYNFEKKENIMFYDDYFEIKNLGRYTIIEGNKIEGVVGDIISMSKNYTQIISRRANLIYYNKFNSLINKYAAKEIELKIKNYEESYLSPNGNFLVLKDGLDKYVLFDIESQTETKYFSGKFLAFSDEGNIIYQDGNSRNAVVIDPITFENITPDNYHYYRFISPDGKLYAQLANSYRYYHRIKNEYVEESVYNELKKVLDSSQMQVVKTENGEIDIKKWILEKHQDFFKSNGIYDISYVNVDNIIEKRKYIEIGIVGTSVKTKIDFPQDLFFYNYSSFSYDNKYFAYVGKPRERGIIGFAKIHFDEKDNKLEVLEIKEIRKPKNAAWVCSFSSNGYFATYDSNPITYMIKMGEDFFEEWDTNSKNENKLVNVDLIQKEWKEIFNKNFLCFSPSGKYFALSQQGYDPLSLGGNGHRSSNTLHIANTNSIEIKMSFNDHGSIIKTDISKKIIFVAFSEDESKIMSLSTDGVVIVRNIKTENEDIF